MNYDPDFLLIANGVDVTQSLMNWHLSLPDNDSCSLSFQVENQNSQYAGLFLPNIQVSFCFGYMGYLQPMITLDILSIAPEFNVGIKTVKITAYDEIHKLCGGNMQGAFKKGVDTKQAIKDTIKNYTGIDPEVGLDSPKFASNFRIPCIGKTPMQLIDYCKDMSFTDKGDEIKSYYQDPVAGPPESFAGTADPGWRQPATSWKARTDSRNPDSSQQNKDNTIDQNRNKNMNKKRNSGTITAKLALMGYPDLRPSACITVLNVDEYSGDWYCNHVDHMWSNENAQYLTSASLQKGEIDKGESGEGSKAPNPMVVSCDPFKKSIYCGPRKTDAASQATFVYGVGQEVISFHPSISTEKKGASQGVGSKGKLIDAAGKSSNQYAEGGNRTPN